MKVVLNGSHSDQPKLFPELVSSLMRPLCLAIFVICIVGASFLLVIRSGELCRKTLDVSGRSYTVSIYENRTGIYASTVGSMGFMGRGRSGTCLIASQKSGLGVPEVKSLRIREFNIDVSPDGGRIVITNGEFMWQSEPRYSTSFVLVRN